MADNNTNNKKKKIIDDATKIDSSFLQGIFGGDKAADPSSPNFNGHFHTGQTDVWGHAPKIDLTQHTIGRLTLQDSFVVAKSVSAYPSIIATQNNIISGTLLNVPNSNLQTKASLTLPNSSLPNNVVLTAQTFLDGYINNSVTTIPASITSGFFTSGVIIIDTEQIFYNNITSAAFTGCVRGFGGTTAASHLDNSVIISATTEQLSGTLGTQNGSAPTSININGSLNGSVNIGLNNVFGTSGITTPTYPFTTPDILTTAIWYFGVPLDMDITKASYFTFDWMGDISTTDNNGNPILDTTKLTLGGVPAAQTTTFRITWQWYSAGYAVFPPAVIYDGYTPANIVGSNINTNSLTRGRIPNMTTNNLPFQLVINDSVVGNPNYVGLTGQQQASNSVMVGVQVDVLGSGFVNNVLGAQSGHLNFFQGNFTYFSKTMGSPVVSFKTL